MLSDPEAIFLGQQRRGLFPGGQMVVRAGGEIILEISVGLARGLRADEGSRVSVSEDTSFQVLSASKPVVAFATAVLEDRGLLDVSRSVSAGVRPRRRERPYDSRRSHPP